MVKWTCKLWKFRKIENLRRWRHAPWLTATAVATDSRHRFSKSWHIANVKNITGDDQATLIVNQNSADIAYTFQFYVCLHLRDSDCCSMADGNDSCHGFAPSFFEEITCCRRQKHRRRWLGNPNGQSNSWNITYTFRFFVCLHHEIASDAPRLTTTAISTDSRHRFSKRWHIADVKNIAGKDQNRSKFCNYQNLCLRDQTRPLENIFLLLGCRHYDAIANCFFSYCHL